MFVACNTLCFAQEPMETALRHIVELEFDKFELALVEGGQHLRLSEAGDDPEARWRRSGAAQASFRLLFISTSAAVNWSDPLTAKRFEGLCRLAKSLSIAVITMHAAPRGTPIDRRSQTAHLNWHAAFRKGLVLALLTHSETLTADPQVAVELCQAVPGIGAHARPQPFPAGTEPRRRFRRRVSVRTERAPARHRNGPRRISSARRPGKDRLRPNCEHASTAWIQSLAHRHRSSIVPTIRSTGKSKCASSSSCSRR